jgi:hypothetical protein
LRIPVQCRDKNLLLSNRFQKNRSYKTGSIALGQAFRNILCFSVVLILRKFPFN